MSALSNSEFSCKISIVLPVYNGSKTLAVAIQSIVLQSFSDWELLVIDDGSTDDSIAIAKQFKDTRIQVIENLQNEGLAAKLNQGISLSRGQYFARMDQDDIAYPERLVKQFAYLEDNPATDLVAARAVIFTSDGEALGLLPFYTNHAEICARPWSGFYMPHPTWVGRLSWFKLHCYRMPEVVRGEDQELLLRTYHESIFACLPEVLLAYRLDDISWNNSRTARLNLMPWFWRTHWAHRRYGYALMSIVSGLIKLTIEFGSLKLGRHDALRAQRTRAMDAETVSNWQSVWQIFGKNI